MPFGIVNKITFIVSCTVLRIRSSGVGRFRICHSTFEFDTLSDSLIMLSIEVIILTLLIYYLPLADNLLG